MLNRFSKERDSVNARTSPKNCSKDGDSAGLPNRSSFSLSSLTSSYRKGLLATVANTLSTNRRPETPPAVVRAMLGLHSSGNTAPTRPMEGSSSMSPGKGTSGRERERELLNKKAEETGVFSLTDSQLERKYNFEKEIGFGNWGSCWLAHTRLDSDGVPRGSKIAVKLVHRQGTPPSNARVKALWNEYKVLRACGKPVHCNIVQFKEFIITPSYAIVVMDFYQQAMNVALPLSTYAGSSGYFQQLLSSLQWLHGKSVTHCDIKVANLMVDTREDKEMGKPVLVDFGFATLHDSKTKFKTKQSWGTPEYLSPERSRGDLHDERLSDIWALGVTFFEIATGRTPFEHEDEQFLSKEQLEIYYARTLKSKWVGSWSIPAELESLCRLMLAPNVQDRILSTQALQSDLFHRPGEDYVKVFSTDKYHDLLEEELKARKSVRENNNLPTSESDSKVTDTTAPKFSAEVKCMSAATQTRVIQSPAESSVTHTSMVSEMNSTKRSPSTRSQTQASTGIRRECGLPTDVGSSEGGSHTSDEGYQAQDDSSKEVCLFETDSSQNHTATANPRFQWTTYAESRGVTRVGQCSYSERSDGTDKDDARTGIEEGPRMADTLQRLPISHGVSYDLKDVPGARSHEVVSKVTRKPVEYLDCEEVGSRGAESEQTSYEIMADKRAVTDTKRGNWQLCPAISTSQAGNGLGRDNLGVHEKLNGITNHASNGQDGLPILPFLQPQLQVDNAERSCIETEDLAARLDEMGVLATSLARMVEETKTKLSRINDENAPKLSLRRDTYHDDLSHTPQKTKPICTSTVLDVDPDCTPTNRSATVSRTGSSVQSHTTPTSKNKAFSTIRKKISMTIPGRKVTTPNADLFTSGQRIDSSHILGHYFHEGPEMEARLSRLELQSAANAGHGAADPDARSSISRTTSMKGRTLGHFLTRYGSRNCKAGTIAKGSTELEDGARSLVHQCSSLQLSLRGLKRSPGGKANERVQREPLHSSFVDGGVVDAASSSDFPSRCTQRATAAATSDDMASSSTTKISPGQKPPPALASRHLSRLYPHRTDVVKSLPLNLTNAPLTKQQATPEQKPISSLPEGTLTRMKSINVIRPTSSNVIAENSLYRHHCENASNSSSTISPMSPLFPQVGEDTPQHHQKSKDSSTQSMNCARDSSTAPPGGNLWNRLFRGVNSSTSASSRHFSSKVG